MKNESIQICGIGAISAIGINANENYASLLSERCGIGCCEHITTAINVPVGEVKMCNDQLKSLLDIPHNLTISRTALLGAIAAKEAVRDAHIPTHKRIGLISSTSVGGMDLSEQFYVDYINDSNKGKLRNIIGQDCSVSTEFIANQCNINDFRTTISTACSSGLNAIIMGAKMLECDMLDYVVVGGTDALCRFTINGFKSLSILDDELCKPMDRDRNGLNLGEGAGYIVLTKEENPHKTYCHLSAYANANDAFHQTASSDNGDGAFIAMSKALMMSNLTPSDINYINLHGTGTQNNDLSELRAVKRLFNENVPDCSSTKPFTGHTLAAAGALEAVYSVMAIANGVKYNNLRFENTIEDGFYPLTNTITNTNVDNVMSNSFGFGGNCSSVIFSKTPKIKNYISKKQDITKSQYYINCLKTDTTLSRDLKVLVPNMNIRRRMSNILKMGVSTALDSISDFEKANNISIDSIITATWFGCLADSEKFLKNLIESDEQLLNPTPFIQSTFNTIGAQVALITNKKCYNNTFTHNTSSMKCAITDAILQLELNEAKAVLVGCFDEAIPTTLKIFERLRIKKTPKSEVIFFVLTKEKLPTSADTIKI